MLNLVVALSCEAKPLIDALKLRWVSEKGPFPIFLGDDVSLILSGIGKLNAAAATAWLHAAHSGNQDQAWLNVGTAGHAAHRIGSGILGHKIRDMASRQCWYPPLTFPATAVTGEIVTVDQVQMGYPPTGCFEMEAAGFYTAASRFSTLELVHCYKVITDNPRQPYTEITPELVTALVAERLPEILDICEHLRKTEREWAEISAPPPGYERLIACCHFTVNQRHQLHDLLTIWRHIGPPPEGIERMRHARAILKALREGIPSL